MKGNCEHIVQVEKNSIRTLAGEMDPPGVYLFNSDDQYYYTIFERRAEVEAFIAKLSAAADEMWPVQPQS